jgi:nucleoside 2-deoxyribosyltransferase
MSAFGETMKIYLAGPLFTASELEFNRQIRDCLEKAGHNVWLPQEQTAGVTSGSEVFHLLLKGIADCDLVVANMDGSDPDSGTCWECGYAYGIGKPTVLFRTDIRSRGDFNLSRYNLMMWASATRRLDGPFATVKDVASALVACLGEVAGRS